MSRLWLLSVLVLTGCAPTLDQLASRSWFQSELGGVRVTTPVSQDAANAAARSLEERRFAMTSVFGADAASQTPIDVIVLPGDAYDEINKGTAGFFQPGSFPLLVLRGEGASGDASSVRVQTHELAHAFVHQRIESLPKWLDEGLAVWLQTMTLTEKTIVLGRPPLHEYRSALSGGRVSREGLFQWSWGPRLSQAETAEMYSSAWAWVAYLMSEHPDRLTRLIIALGQKRAAEDTWSQVFAGAPPTEQTLTTFLKFGAAVILTLPRVERPASALISRALRPDEAMLRVARLELVGAVSAERKARSTTRVKQGLALHPESVEAVALARLLGLREGVSAEPEAGVADRISILPPPTNDACRNIQLGNTLEASMPLRSTQWVAHGIDPWPPGTDGESYELPLDLTGGAVEVLAGSMHRRGEFDEFGATVDDTHLRGPFAIFARRAEGGRCVIGSWRAEFPKSAALVASSTWVARDGSRGLVLLGFDVDRERRWVVLATDGRRLWFALQSDGNTQAITPLAKLSAAADGSARVVFGPGAGADVWRFDGETLTR